MKSVLLMLFACFVVVPSEAGELARIRDQKTHREIVYRTEGNQMVFDLVQGDRIQELNRIEFAKNGDWITLEGDQKKYRFNFFKKFLNASRNGYLYCWSVKLWENEEDLPMAYQGFIAGGIGILITMPLCAVLPAIPTLIGMPAIPVDSAISLIDVLFDSDQVAKRKFDRFINGASMQVPAKVFSSLLNQISKL